MTKVEKTNHAQKFNLYADKIESAIDYLISLFGKSEVIDYLE